MATKFDIARVPEEAPFMFHVTSLNTEDRFVIKPETIAKFDSWNFAAIFKRAMEKDFI